MNKVILIGRIATDLELKATPSGHYVCDFTIAVNRYKGDADFIRCVAWNKSAENLVNYQRKGSLIGVEGAIQVDSYTDRDGKKQYKTYINANNIEFLGKPAELKTEPQEPKYTEPTQSGVQEDMYNYVATDDAQDDLPF